MSYCRFSEADVYVYTSDLGIECCFCPLQQREWVDEPSHPIFGGYYRDVGEKIEDTFRTNAGMIEHLELHRAAGHYVPDDVFGRLRDPEDEAANLRIWAKCDAEKAARAAVP